jgi:hypothetical protein
MSARRSGSGSGRNAPLDRAGVPAEHYETDDQWVLFTQLARRIPLPQPLDTRERFKEATGSTCWAAAIPRDFGI